MRLGYARVNLVKDDEPALCVMEILGESWGSVCSERFARLHAYHARVIQIRSIQTNLLYRRAKNGYKVGGELTSKTFFFNTEKAALEANHDNVIESRFPCGFPRRYPKRAGTIEYCPNQINFN